MTLDDRIGEVDPDECTTTKSFGDPAIPDGTTLITRTYYRITESDQETFSQTDAFYDALESAFTWAYLGSIDERGVQEHVGAAIDDARAVTAADFADADPTTVDVRTDVIPTFYRYVADFHCSYRE